jgi:hypothetical protein
VSTLSTLTNVQNSLFVPNLGDLLNRTPTYTLSRPAPSLDDETAGETAEREEKLVSDRPHLHTSISSVIGELPFAVLPDGSSLNGWTTEDVLELNDHVRHMLHSRRSKFKRAMKGFAQYASKRKLYCAISLCVAWLTGPLSPRVSRYPVCNINHLIWSRLGSLPHRCVLRSTATQKGK